MRSPRGCRSPCRFKVRAPNRFNWHLRPWTQHKSLRRAERGAGEESGGAITVSFVFATLCWGNFSTLNGSELTTIAMWARGKREVWQIPMDAHGKPSGLRTQQLSTVREKKNPMGVWREQLNSATKPDAFEDGQVGYGDVLWPSFAIFFQPLI